MSECGTCGNNLDSTETPFGVLECPACGASNFTPCEVGKLRFDSFLASSPVFDLYSGYDSASRFYVEITILRSDSPEYDWCRKTFIEETENIMRLRHMNTCPILGSGEIEGNPYITEPALDGTSLDALTPDKHPLIAIDKILTILQSASVGLAVAHGQKLAHHDISPENIHIDGRGTVRVKGFFISRFAYLFDQLMISSGGDQCTDISPFLISPEKAESGTEDYRGDVFSMGVLFYYFLTGNYPFHGESENDTIYSRIKSEDKRRDLAAASHISGGDVPDYLPPPPPNSLVSSIPSDLSDMILKTLAYYPNVRLSISEVIDRLNFMRAKAESFNVRKRNEDALNSETTAIPKMSSLGKGFAKN